MLTQDVLGNEWEEIQNIAQSTPTIQRQNTETYAIRNTGSAAIREMHVMNVNLVKLTREILGEFEYSTSKYVKLNAMRMAMRKASIFMMSEMCLMMTGTQINYSITRAEGPRDCNMSPVRFTNFDDARKWLIVQPFPKNGSYDKTDFTIEWEDGGDIRRATGL